MKKDFISVIVPVYNTADYLEKCIESIRNQDYKKLQIILVDDGSTDASGKICDHYADMDERIEAVHIENGGLVGARKRGLQVAEGEYIGFVDSDDYIDTGFYSGMLKGLKDNDADFVHSMEIIEKTGRGEVLDSYRCGKYHCGVSHAEFIREYMLETDEGHYMSNGIVSKLFKAELVKKHYVQIPNHQTVGEDMICSCCCILDSKVFYLDDMAGYHYVQRQDSVMRTRGFNRLIDFCGLYQCLYHVFERYNVLNELLEPLQNYFQTVLFGAFLELPKGKHISNFWFPGLQTIRGKKIILYGAGKVGEDYYAQLCKYSDIEIVAWVDRNYKEYHYEYRDVLDRNSIKELSYDFLVIAVLNKGACEEIRKELIEMGIEKAMILWEKPRSIF